MSVSTQDGKTAKQYAQEQLGSLDLSYLDDQTNSANNTYNTTKKSLETNWNNLQNQLASNRADYRKNFNTGRSTIAESAYDTDRSSQTSLASRGIGNSGLKGLNEVGNRMETGQQYSDLANQFYSDMSDLDTTEKEAKSQYDIDLETAKNTLDSALANVAAQRGEATNNYNLSLGNLAEQVQSRWDSNYNSEQSLKQQQAAAAQAHADAVKAAQATLKQSTNQELYNIISTDATAQTKINSIAQRFGVSTDTARNIYTSLVPSTSSGVLPDYNASLYAMSTPMTSDEIYNAIYGK